MFYRVIARKWRRKTQSAQAKVARNCGLKGWLKTLIVGAVSLLFLSVGQGVLAQERPDTSPPSPSGGRWGKPLPDLNDTLPTFADSRSSIHRESRVLSRGPLAPAKEDREAFRDFLRDKHS